MNNNENQYYIYIRGTKERIPVAKQEFDDYYRDINSYRRTEMNNGRCVCPRSKWLSCDMDCLTCPFHRHGNQYSLDATVNGDCEDARALGEDIPGVESQMEDIFTDIAEFRQLFDRLAELMPEASTIGNLRLDGLSDTAISKRLGISRTTFLSRLKKAKKVLADEFPELF